MEYRRLGQRGPDFSVIGLGAWAFGGDRGDYGWGPQDERDSMAAIHRSLDLGVNWIDTAAVYGLGYSEAVVGRAIRDRTPRPFIATKCGYVWDDRGATRNDLSPASVRREVEASLRRLGVEAIDLYQCHAPDRATPVEETWLAMGALQDEGKVRYLGVSNFGMTLIERCLAIRHVDAVQPPYSLLERGIERRLLPFCVRRNIGVIVYSPLRSGLLSGRFDPARLAPGDWRRRSSAFRPPRLDRALSLVERLRPIAARRGKTPAQLAIAWVLRQETVTAAIVGARSPAQVEENTPAADLTLSPDDMAEIDRALKETR